MTESLAQVLFDMYSESSSPAPMPSPSFATTPVLVRAAVPGPSSVATSQESWIMFEGIPAQLTRRPM